MLLGLALSLTEHLDSDSGEKLFHSLGLGQCLTSHHTEQYKFLEYGSIKYKNHHYQCHLTKIDDRIYSQKKKKKSQAILYSDYIHYYNHTTEFIGFTASISSGDPELPRRELE